MADVYQTLYNPDVLSCLANLSNDEVFTPPEVANRMLDLLPQELFRSPDTTFLDPACKSGVFLREIAKRLLVGLENEIPDSSWSADLEAGSDFKEGDARCSVRVFERYSMMGGNRLSLTLTMFQNADSPVRLSAITAGGSQAVFFKVNTLGEESFLDDVKELLEEILEE